jgi:hypothetical protein
MMMSAVHILGRGNDDWGGIIGVVLLLIFWGIGALGQASSKQKKKQQQESRRMREVRERMEAERGRAAGVAQTINPNMTRRQPAVLAPPVGYQRSPVIRPAPVRRAPAAIPPARRAAAQLTTAPPLPVTPVTQLAAATVQTKQPVAQTQVGSGDAKPARPTASGATAVAIAEWMKPETLRRQFILTEIFQPPISLRENTDAAPWQR